MAKKSLSLRITLGHQFFKLKENRERGKWRGLSKPINPLSIFKIKLKFDIKRLNLTYEYQSNIMGKNRGKKYYYNDDNKLSAIYWHKQDTKGIVTSCGFYYSYTESVQNLGGCWIFHPHIQTIQTILLHDFSILGCCFEMLVWSVKSGLWDLDLEQSVGNLFPFVLGWMWRLQVWAHLIEHLK
jgi:hypothetical protein